MARKAAAMVQNDWCHVRVLRWWAHHPLTSCVEGMAHETRRAGKRGRELQCREVAARGATQAAADLCWRLHLRLPPCFLTVELAGWCGIRV